jgi:hypothetical protein
MPSSDDDTQAILAAELEQLDTLLREIVAERKALATCEAELRRLRRKLVQRMASIDRQRNSSEE